MSGKDSEDKVRLLRALAFHIHKKESATDALMRCFEDEGRGGRHRQWRQAIAVLETEGFVPALLTAGLIGDEAAQILGIVAAAADHRQLSAAIGSLADYWDK